MRNWDQMLLRAVWLLGLLFPLQAQFLVQPGSREARELEPYFGNGAKGPATDPGKLACSIYPFPARLSFNFQYWTGYDVGMPTKQFENQGRDKPIAMALQIIPQKTPNAPAYLFSRASFPRRIPPEYWAMKGVEMNLGGGFLLGPGKYRVSLLVMDSSSRVCRKSWNVDAHNAKVPLQIAPGEVREAGMEQWKGLTPASGTGKVSVYLHAAPFFRRRNVTQLQAWDRTVLAGSLRSILDSSGFAEARVTVFDFDGRRVLFESESFGPEEYERLLDTLLTARFGTVSVSTLQGPNEGDFLLSMMRKELERASPSDALVFLGPTWRWGDKVTPLQREIRAQLPPTYYVSLTPWYSGNVDILERFTKAGPRGKVLTVYEPTGLAKAIREIRERRASPSAN
jgi:hypothetical protein